LIRAVCFAKMKVADSSSVPSEVTMTAIQKFDSSSSMKDDDDDDDDDDDNDGDDDLYDQDSNDRAPQRTPSKRKKRRKRNAAQRSFSFMGIVTDEPDELPMEAVKDEDRVDHVEKIDAYRLFVSLGGVQLGAKLATSQRQCDVRVRFVLGEVTKEIFAGRMTDDVVICEDIHEIHFTEGERPANADPFDTLHGPHGKKWLKQVRGCSLNSAVFLLSRCCFRQNIYILHCFSL